MNNILFRWAVGDGHNQILQLRLSVISLHRYFPDCSFVALYNGSNYPSFVHELNSMKLSFIQTYDQSKFKSPFKFIPDKNTAWWKWIPIDLCLQPIEVVIDTDVIFLRDPVSIRNWSKSDSNFLAAMEPPNVGLRSTNAGNFCRQLHDCDDLINVGIIGIKDNSWRNLFIRKSNEVSYGHSDRSKHIDEQGLANVALSIGEKFGTIKTTKVPMDVFCWFDFLDTTDRMELLHFVAYRKDSLFRYYSFWNHVIQQPNYFDHHPEDYHALHRNSISVPVDPSVYRAICHERCISKAEFYPQEDLLP